MQPSHFNTIRHSPTASSPTKSCIFQGAHPVSQAWPRIPQCIPLVPTKAPLPCIDHVAIEVVPCSCSHFDVTGPAHTAHSASSTSNIHHHTCLTHAAALLLSLYLCHTFFDIELASLQSTLMHMRTIIYSNQHFFLTLIPRHNTL